MDVADEKRTKEHQALENADNFANDMLGEFFKEVAVDTEDFKQHLLDEQVTKECEQQVDAELIVM